jgi:putative transposase
VYDLKCHLVWITKYRKKALSGQVAERLRDLLRGICKTKDVEIIKGSISKDHVHLFVSVPPYPSVSKLMQPLKGKTSYKLLAEYKELSRQFWGRHIWGRGYFAVSSGNVPMKLSWNTLPPRILKIRMAISTLPHNGEAALADSG